MDYEDKIVLDPSFTNNEKVKCVYDKLKGLSSIVFNDIINDHFDSAKNADLQFKIVDIITGEDAQTRPSYNPLTGIAQYQIVLDSNFVENASTIEIALTIIHESIHAELIERCIRLGLIATANYIPSVGVNIVFGSSPTVFSLESAIFNQLLVQYGAFPPTSNSDWNHDFLTNINNDPFVAAGPYTLNDLMDYLSWIGLEDTNDYITNVFNISLELSKKVYVQTAVKSKYTNNCN